MKKILSVEIVILLFFISIIPPTAKSSHQFSSLLVNRGDTSELRSFNTQVLINKDKLPDLTIELNITSESTYWRIRTTIYNKGTATIPAETPIIWKVNKDSKSLYWIKVIPFFPFEPNTSINGLPESQELKLNKLLWRGHAIQVVVDPPYEKDYPWIELDPDPIFGLILELDENNNYDDYTFPKVFSVSLEPTIKQTKTAYSSFIFNSLKI